MSGGRFISGVKMGRCGCCNKPSYQCDYIIFTPIQEIDMKMTFPSYLVREDQFFNELYMLPFPLLYNSSYFKIENSTICPSSNYSTSTGVYYDLCSCSDISHTHYPKSLKVKNNTNILINDDFKNISNTYQKYNSPFKCNCESNSQFDYSRDIFPEIYNSNIIDKNGKEFFTMGPLGTPFQKIDSNGISTTGIINEDYNLLSGTKFYFRNPNYSYIKFRSASGDSYQRFSGSGDIVSASIEMCENIGYVTGFGYEDVCSRVRDGQIGIFTSKIEFLEPIKANLWELTSITGVSRDQATNRLEATYPIYYRIIPPEDPPEVEIEEKSVKLTMNSNIYFSENIPHEYENCGMQRISNKAKGIAENLVNIVKEYICGTHKVGTKYSKQLVINNCIFNDSLIFNIDAPDLEDFNTVAYHNGFLPIVTKGITALSSSASVDYSVVIDSASFFGDMGRSFISFSGGEASGTPKYFDACGNIQSGFLSNRTFCNQYNSILVDPVIKNVIQYGHELSPFNFIRGHTNNSIIISRIFGSPLPDNRVSPRLFEGGGIQMPAFPHGKVIAGSSELYQDLIAYYRASILWGPSNNNIPPKDPPIRDVCNGTSSRIAFQVTVDLIMPTVSTYIKPGDRYSCYYKNNNCISTNICDGNVLSYDITIQPYDSAVAFGVIDMETSYV